MATLTETKPFLTVPEVADLIGVSSMRTYQLIGEGVIPAVRVGHRIRIPRQAFGCWIDGLNREALASCARSAVPVEAGA